MEIAVLSDIHGNYLALQRCLEALQDKKIDLFLFLGDYVGELAFPQKTMDILFSLKQKWPCCFIKGNKEDYWLDYRKNNEKGWKEWDSTTGCLYYAYHHLTRRDLDFFGGLSHKKELSFQGLPALTVCHGSPDRVNEKLLPDDENTFSIMERDANSYIVCGHTHIAGVIEHNGKKIFNAGSVGLPLPSGGKTQFLILHGREDAWDSEYINLEYDVETVIFDLHASGLSGKAPSWCKVSEQLLRGGNVSHGTVLSRAMELCREDTGGCDWPDIPEIYWERAVKELL